MKCFTISLLLSLSTLLSVGQKSGVQVFIGKEVVKVKMKGKEILSYEKIFDETMITIDSISKFIIIEVGGAKELKTIDLMMDSKMNGSISYWYYIKGTYDDNSGQYLEKVVITPSERSVKFYKTISSDVFTNISITY